MNAPDTDTPRYSGSATLISCGGDRITARGDDLRRVVLDLRGGAYASNSDTIHIIDRRTGQPVPRAEWERQP